MPRQEQGIEYYFTKAGEKRFRVRWWEGSRHPSRSFGRLTGSHGARAFYRKVRHLQEAGRPVVQAESRELTLAVFAAETWAPRAKRRLAPNTWEQQSQIYNNHILHQLGYRPTAETDAEVLVEWQDELEEAGVGAPTVIKAISILSSIFREAARRPRVTGVRMNPVALLDKPSAKRRRRPRVWGPVVVEQVRYELLVNSRRINPAKELMALRDTLLVGFMEMTGCRPGEALALRWRDLEARLEITHALSGNVIVDRTKTEQDRVVSLMGPLSADLAALRELSGDGPDDYVFRNSNEEHWTKDDWDNYRSRHFVPALERVEAKWEQWREDLDRPEDVRESVAGLTKTRPYDLGRHTHSALMLAAGMTLQRLAKIQGHSIRVLSETYAEELEEFQDRDEPIDPIEEIERARILVWVDRNPSTGAPALAGR